MPRDRPSGAKSASVPPPLSSPPPPASRTLTVPSSSAMKDEVNTRHASKRKRRSAPADEQAAQTGHSIPDDAADSVPVRVYCDGIYDLFHFGHARALEQAKKAFPNVHLLVGVCNDQLTHEKKGKTVMNAAERAESLRHCRWVDEVVENAPWVIDQAFLDKHKIDFVAHDDLPYQSGDHSDVYAFVKEQGKFLATKRTEGVSTSELITRIVRDYDKYVRRNLERGVSPRDLNVGFLKEKEIMVKKQVEDITHLIRDKLREGEGYLKQNWSDTRDEVMNSLEQLDEKSNELIRGFLALFGGDGVMGKLWRRPINGNGSASSSRANSPVRRPPPDSGAE